MHISSVFEETRSPMPESIGRVALYTLLLVETLFICINQYCCVLILNCFIVNNKGGRSKRKWYSVTI